MLVDSTGLKIYGVGQWLEEKHGAMSRRGWRKLHLALDADNGEIIAHALTEQDTGDASQVEPLLELIDTVLRHSSEANIVIPPRSNAVERANSQAFSQRDNHITSIQTDGRLKWQAATGYGKRGIG